MAHIPVAACSPCTALAVRRLQVYLVLIFFSFLFFFFFLLYRHFGGCSFPEDGAPTVCSHPKCHVSTGPASPASHHLPSRQDWHSPSLLKCSWEIQQLWKRSTFQITKGCVPGGEGGRVYCTRRTKKKKRKKKRRMVEGCEAAE